MIPVIGAVCLGTALLSGCTSYDDAVEALVSAGYSDIEITGYNVFSCGNDDLFHTGFVAKNPMGKIVEGTVCSGVFKGSTIRF